jgi:3-keto-disaccharide hydrolase
MRNLWLPALVVMAGLVAANRVPAGDTEPGFTSLFNGKDLTGWVYKGSKEELTGKTETADKRFTVEKGVIVAQEGKGIKDLYTTKLFSKDFQLKVEFRASLKSDSGVYVRGAQLQVRDYIRRNERPQLKGKFKDDDWNSLDITVKAGVIVSKVNGKDLTASDVLKLSIENGQPTAKLNGNDVAVKDISVKNSIIAKCYCNGIFLEDMVVPAAGGIGLQAETGKFEFRNIRFKELP